MANEEKRQERATMRPPDTAVRRVDLSRQREIENGEMRRDTEVERGASQPEERERECYCERGKHISGLSGLSLDI